MRVFILSAILVPNLSFAAPETKFVSVSGHCLKKVTPDRGSVQLTAEAKEDNPTAASRKASALYEKLRGEIKKMSLKDTQLQTSDFNVNPDYDYINGKQKLRGYRATLGVEIETAEIGRMGELIELGAKLGIQNAGALYTFLSPEKRKEVHEECLEEAIKNARSKADKLARAGGAKLGEVLTIEENRNESRTPPQPRMLSGAAMAMEKSAGDAAPTMESKSQSVEVTIAVAFSLK